MENWAIRLRFKVAKTLLIDAHEFIENLNGSQCRFIGEENKSLRESYWWIVRASGFTSELIAREYGGELVRALKRVALTRDIGMDFGLDQASSGFGQVVADAVEKQGGKLHQNVHGLMVFQEHGNEVFFHFTAAGTVFTDAAMFRTELRDAFNRSLKWSDRVAAAVDLIVLSKMAKEPLSEAALCISAVEHLATAEIWTGDQLAVLQELEQLAGESSLPKAKAQEVANAVRQCFKSIRQQIRSTLRKLGMHPDALKEFDRIYSLRSGILHGSHLDRESYQQLATDARALCSDIVRLAVDADAEIFLATPPQG